MSLSPATVSKVVADVIAEELLPAALDKYDPADLKEVRARAAGHGVSATALAEASKRYARTQRAVALRAEKLALKIAD